jgi:uncharacterized membrane-anchored protein YitT (DUF2179 family)
VYMIRKMLSVLIGSLLVGIGVNLFLVPFQLMDGGMIGIGLLAKYYFQLPPGLVMIMCSVPIYALVFFYDRKLFYQSFHGMLLSSLCIDLLSPLREWSQFTLPQSAVIGGFLIGSGIGLMLAYNTNTGGTDLLAQFLAKQSGLPVALMIFFIDGIIIACSLEVIGLLNTVFSLVTIITVAVATHYFCQIGQKRQPWVVVGPLSSYLKKQGGSDFRGRKR